MIRGLKMSLCVLVCFGFFYDYHCGAAEQFIISLLICFGVCPLFPYPFDEMLPHLSKFTFT